MSINEKILQLNECRLNSIQSILDTGGVSSFEHTFTEIPTDIKTIQGRKIFYPEYIMSNNGQYLDTSVSAINGCKIEIKTQISNSATVGEDFGAFVGTQNKTDPWGCQLVRAKGTSWTFLVGSSQSSFSGNYLDTHIWEIATFKGDSYVKIDGETIGTISDTKDRSSNNIYLFGYNKGNGTRVGYKGIIIYYCKIWDENDNLIRDFIPYYDVTNNFIGMYDNINKRIHQSISGQPFLYGPIA